MKKFIFFTGLLLCACQAPTPPSTEASAINLDTFTLDWGPRVIDGVSENASGLTWNWDTQQLAMVTNDPPMLIHMSTEADVVGSQPLPLEDVEGIAYIGNGSYAVIEERREEIVLVKWTPTSIDISGHLTVADHTALGRLNAGMEGIAYDQETQSVRVVNEKWPMRMWLTSATGHETGQSVACPGGQDLGDWAGLATIQASSHFLLLSEESKRVVELDQSCRLVAALSVASSKNGAMPQPEGLTMIDQNTLYIVSEPNLIYRFTRPMMLAQSEDPANADGRNDIDQTGGFGGEIARRVQ